MREVISKVAIALAVVLGGGTLAMTGIFLFAGPPGVVDLGLSLPALLTLDAALCLAFCVQHSVMVRRTVRRRLESLVPAHYQGVVFTLTSAVFLIGMILLWQESRIVLVELEGGARLFVRALWLATLPGFVWAARSIPRFDPLGVDPIRDRMRGRAHRSWPFTVRGPYRWVRHPQYFLTLVLIWAYPDLTADRLLLDGILTAWIVLGTKLEERDLVEDLGSAYVDYRRHVPMLVPWRGPRDFRDA